MNYVYWAIIVFAIVGLYAAITTYIQLNKIKKQEKQDYINSVSEDIKKVKHPIFKK